MLSPTLQFDVTSEQQQLLHAYQAQAASLKVTSEEFDGWLERIDEISGVEVSQLTALHGQLIASGMLKFEISGRSVGLKYQLSQQGKKALEVKAVDDEDELLDDSCDMEEARVDAIAKDISVEEPADAEVADDVDTVSAADVSKSSAAAGAEPPIGLDQVSADQDTAGVDSTSNPMIAEAA